MIGQRYEAASIIDIEITDKLFDNVRRLLTDHLHSEEEARIHDAMERFGAAYRLAELCVEEAKLTYKWVDDYDD